MWHSKPATQNTSKQAAEGISSVRLPGTAAHGLHCSAFTVVQAAGCVVHKSALSNRVGGVLTIRTPLCLCCFT